MVFHKVSGIECDEYEDGEEVRCDEEVFLIERGNPGRGETNNSKKGV
jgi:hypothetical protein